MRNKKMLAAASAAILAVVWAGPAWATPGTLRKNTPITMTSSFDVSVACSNSKGATITFSNSASYDVTAYLQFQSANGKWDANSNAVSGSVSMRISGSNGGTISAVKQPSLGGVGGNPYVWLMDGGSLGVGDFNLNNAQYLGRCVNNPAAHRGGPATVNAAVEASVAMTKCASTGSTGKVGPKAGPNAPSYTMFLDSKWDGTSHLSASAASVSFSLDLGNVTFPNGQSFPGMGGNPYVAGTLDDPNLGFQFLGRCKDLF